MLAELEKLDEGRGTGTRPGKTRPDPPASVGLTVSDSAAQPLDQWPTGLTPPRTNRDTGDG